VSLVLFSQRVLLRQVQLSSFSPGRNFFHLTHFLLEVMCWAEFETAMFFMRIFPFFEEIVFFCWPAGSPSPHFLFSVIINFLSSGKRKVFQKSSPLVNNTFQAHESSFCPSIDKNANDNKRCI